MNKRTTGLFMVICVLLNLSTIVMASEPEYKRMLDDSEINEKVRSSVYVENITPNYISVDEYLAKYGAINVIRGFNKAEIAHKVNVLKTANESERASLQNDIAMFSSEPNDLYLSITDGKFLGKDIIGISDLPPDDTRLSVKIRSDDSNNNQNIMMTNEKQNDNIAVANATTTKKSYDNYDVYYSDSEPDNETDLLGGAYEPKAGTYMYKYSYSHHNNYLCSTNVQFSNTQLKCGTQQNCMYAYVAAKSNQRTFDFGLMANPADSTRNQGLYAFFNPGDNSGINVEGYPKVQATSYGSNMMTLENKTVTIRLSVGNGTVEMYMEMDGNCIYYKTEVSESLISGSSMPLTFVQAMTCVERNENDTSLTSGSYFKNVRFYNTCLYSFESSNARPFSAYGQYTYYTFIAKPSKMTFNYDNTYTGSNNYESMSISYN